MSCINLQRLCKSYGDVQALKNLSLRFEGGIFGFVGPNGSGKTTTIKILTGLIKPDAGKAFVLGLNVEKESCEIRKKIGVSMENPVFPRELSGFDYLIFVGRLTGLSASDVKREAQGLIDWLDLEDAAHRTAVGYSAGMKKRLSLAQAFIGWPELIILDEPTSNLDPSWRARVLDKIKEVNREHGINFFISSHILPELEKVCDSIGLIYGGFLIEQGSLSDLAERYPINMFKVIVSDSHRLIGRLKEAPFVKGLRILNENTVVVETQETPGFYDDIMRVSNEAGVKVFSVTPVQGLLERVYQKTVDTREGNHNYLMSTEGF